MDEQQRKREPALEVASPEEGSSQPSGEVRRPPRAAQTTISQADSGFLPAREEGPRLPDVGEVVDGRYELTAVLGAGGMGAVYAAKNLRTEKEVALKLLLPGGRFRSQRVRRFVREARAAGRIRHPNVVDVYDVGGEDDTPYIVMERLHGESLRERFTRGRLPPEEAVRIVLAAMEGVAEAHRQGVIHRDLKPDNIYLARVPPHEQAVPKVLDFGVSRVLARDEPEKGLTTITRAGTVVGTPAYMPLEQLRGAAEIDARVDVYALGVILYEALTGERPYQASNDHDLVVQMATTSPTPLSIKVRSIDASLDAIVMRALSRELNQRFASVAEFAAALARWQAGERGPLRAPTTKRASGRWLVALGLSLVIALAALWLVLARPPAAAPVAGPAAPTQDERAKPAPPKPARTEPNAAAAGEVAPTPLPEATPPAATPEEPTVQPPAREVAPAPRPAKPLRPRTVRAGSPKAQGEATEPPAPPEPNTVISVDEF